MLEKLLNEIRSGGTFETSVLAARLGTTPGLVEAMLEHLQRTGHLRPYETCADACGQCSLKNDCKTLNQSNRIRLWQGTAHRADRR